MINQDYAQLNNNTHPEWNDWKWQQRNSIRDEETLKKICNTNWSSAISEQISRNLENRKMSITPYYLNIIVQNNTYKDITENPLWRQVVPFMSPETEVGYDGTTENWELPHEMKTPICQHKYDDRVILRMINTCSSYCQFCYEALRVLETKSKKDNATVDLFQESINYIKSNPAIEEVILSGGDPLMLPDHKIEDALAKIRTISDKILIRIHSRMLTFNPYRLTENLVKIFIKYNVNSFGVHVAHPFELTEDYKKSLKLLQSAVPIICANIPLLHKVNDDKDTLRTLFMDLYRAGVKPYYLYHFMQFSPGSSEYKESIQTGIKIMKSLKRSVSNIAMPEYVLPHSTGKFTIPLIEDVTELPKFENINGKRHYNFINWQGKQCSWMDE